MRIEILTRSHNRQGFDCGNADLNRYLRDTARQHSEKGISRTFVLVDEENSSEILGFFTLASREILVEKLPEKYAKKVSKPSPGCKAWPIGSSKTHAEARPWNPHDD